MVHLLAWLSWTLDQQLRNAQWVERSVALRANAGFDALYRWDSGWYHAVMKAPYTEPQHANFFPAFPLEARALSSLFTLDSQLSLLLASSINALVACIALYLAAEKLIGKEGARWTLIAWLAYPYSFFQATAYSESITVAAGAVALALEVSGKRWLALIGIAFAALTRHTSMYGAIAQSLFRWKRGKWWMQPLPLIAWGLGLSVFCAFLWKTYGDPLMFMTVRKIYWPDGFKPITSLSVAGDPAQMPGAVLSVILCVISTLGLLAHPSTRFLVVPALFWFGVLFVTGASGLGRHAASVWPAFIGLGVLCAKRPALGGMLIAMLAPLGGVMLFLYAHQWHIY